MCGVVALFTRSDDYVNLFVETCEYSLVVSKCRMILVTYVIFSVMLLQVMMLRTCEVGRRIFTSEVSTIK